MTDDIQMALAAMGPGDTSGSETLGRYVYQCKVAVQRWLATLALEQDAGSALSSVDGGCD